LTNDDENLYSKISQWCKEEGIFEKKINNPAHEFLFIIKLPNNLRLEIARPNDKPFLVLSCKTKISPQHLSTLQKSTNMIEFVGQTDEYICERPLDLVFDPKNAQFALFDRIFLDGLTQHNFFNSIREIAHSYRKIIIILNKVCGTRPSKPQQTEKPHFYG